jgi:hypothetical protein
MVDAWLVRGYMTAVEQANAAKQRRNSLPSANDVYARALARVERSPRLRKYQSIIMTDYGGRHWYWVAYATVKEIEAWASQIKEDANG